MPYINVHFLNALVRCGIWRAPSFDTGSKTSCRRRLEEWVERFGFHIHDQEITCSLLDAKRVSSSQWIGLGSCLLLVRILFYLSKSECSLLPANVWQAVILGTSSRLAGVLDELGGYKSATMSKALASRNLMAYFSLNPSA